MKIVKKTGKKHMHWEQYEAKCEFCGHVQLVTGYDHPIFLENKVQEVECEACKKSTFGETLEKE